MLKLNNPIAVLVQGLSINHTDEQIADLRNMMGAGQCTWEKILALANLHRVPLLWYLRMHQNGLADCAPKDLMDYLGVLLEQNRERNSNLIDVLERCLDKFQEHEIDIVLLKGAAALADNLYEDVGARLMGDLDILVRAEDRSTVDSILKSLGFEVHPEHPKHPYYLKHRHLPPYFHPDWDALIEVHLDVVNYWEQKAFPLSRLFSNAEKVSLGAKSVSVLHLSDRLLHNACHAMIQDWDWLYSWFSLHELVEWNLLLNGNENNINFSEMLNYADGGGFAEQLKVYALLANKFFNSPVPEEWFGKKEQEHINRILQGIRCKGTNNPTPKVVRGYHQSHVLYWLWKYRIHQPHIPMSDRLIHLMGMPFRQSSWNRLFLR